MINFKKKLRQNEYLYSILRIPLDLIRWHKRQYLPPSPQFIKLILLKKYSVQSSIFIETGTFHGNSLLNLCSFFVKLYSIEPSEKYFEISKQNLKKKNNVVIINDTSENAFESLIINNIADLTIFLDGHYAGWDTFKLSTSQISSVNHELNIVEKYLFKFKEFKLSIFIDDFRLFGSEGYPDKKFLFDFCIRNSLFFSIEHDMFVIKNHKFIDRYSYKY